MSFSCTDTLINLGAQEENKELRAFVSKEQESSDST